jgi:hypothetical protein
VGHPPGSDDGTFPKIVNNTRIKRLAVENIDEFIDIVRSRLAQASKGDVLTICKATARKK